MNSIMTSRRFAPIFWTQFLSAFSDNLLKNVLVFTVAFGAVGADMDAAGTTVALAGGAFILPFLLFSVLGGQIADRDGKAVTARRIKMAEIAVSLVAGLGIAMGSVGVMIASLFGYGTCAALFGPVKYGILPDQLAPEELPKANAWVEGATFAAILGGTVVGGLLAPMPLVAAIVVPSLAVAGWATARVVPDVGPTDASVKVEANVLRSTIQAIGRLKSDRPAWTHSLSLSWFWALGAAILSVLPTLVSQDLAGDGSVLVLCLVVFAVAVAAGSAAAAWLCSVRVVPLLVPIGAVLAGIAGLDLAWSVSGLSSSDGARGALAFAGSDGSIRVLADLAVAAFASALIAVPAFAAIQARSPADRRGRTVASVNALNAAAMVLASLLVGGLAATAWSPASIVAVVSGLCLVVSIPMFAFMPSRAVSDVSMLWFRIFHRLEVKGMEHLDAAGPEAVLTPNHISFLDAALMLALRDRPPVFAIDTGISQQAWVRPFLRFVEAVPVDPSKPMSTRTLIRAAGQGRPIVIFPEGRISVTGSVMKVYEGAAMVADRTDRPIVPIRIKGLERSPMSRLDARQKRSALFPKTTVHVMEPRKMQIEGEPTPRERRSMARATLADAMNDAAWTAAGTDRTILEAVIATAKDVGMGRVTLEDPVSGTMNYGMLLTASRVLAGKFDRLLGDEKTVGVMLPNSVGTVAVVLGVMSAGRVSAMINFTSGAAAIRGACEAAGVRTIVTSRAFVEKAKLEALVEEVSAAVRIVWTEDVKASVGALDKIVGRLARTRPLRRRGADECAVLLFTSGTEGAPKGVALTSRNVLSNAAQVRAVVDLGMEDKFFNALPMFHSFGLTAGTILPLVGGIPVYLYPSPLHYRIVPELIYSSNATVMFGTDTFLRGYARSSHGYDLRSLRYVCAGAEPVKASTRKMWNDKFGLRIFEGYGVTETAPVLALNTPMNDRHGSVGRLLPGVEHRLVPVEGVEEGGRLHVRGPNVMAGYVRDGDVDRIQAPEGGWHDTGDIVTIDREGFVRIAGRAKRFAKIGGEMVSLAVVETLASELWPEAVSAASIVPDERKGERIVLLTQVDGPNREAFSKAAKAKGISELAVPSKIVHVDQIPLLGTGKIDHVEVGKLARSVTSDRLPDAA